MTIIEQHPATGLPVAPVVPQERLELADVLDGAADLLVREGWAPNGDSYPERCAVMAITAVGLRAGWSPFDLKWPFSEDLVTCALEQYLGLPRHGVPEWNDRQTDAQVVIDALRSCAIAVRSGLL